MKKKVFKPVEGFLFVKAEVIEEERPEVEVAGTLPPSRYFVLDPGSSKYEVGMEVKLKPMSRMIALEKDSMEYVIEVTDVAAYR